MRKHYYFSSEINSASTQELLQFINNNEENLVIFFETEGGNYDCVNVIIDTLNENKDRITLVGTFKLYSGGFLIFFSFQGEKYINFMAMGMIHLANADFCFDQTGKANGETDKFHFSEFKKRRNTIINFCKDLGLNYKEMSKLRSGEDVFLGNERLNQLLKLNQKKK